MQKLTFNDLLHRTMTGDETFYLASEVDALLSSHVVATDQSNLQSLHDRIAELETALREAIEGIGSWSCYATEYFREKHDLDGELKRLNSVLMVSERT